MNRKLVISAGMVTPLLLISICVGGAILTAIGWLLLKPADRPGIIQIMPIAPLSTVEAAPTAMSIENPNEVDESPLAEAELPSPIPVAQAPPTPTLDVEEVLGFNLPEGAINSITQEGVATRLVVPKLNLDAPVVISPIQNQTWQVDHLEQRVGHLEGTAAPGSNSNMVLAGHVTLSAGVYGPFAGLAQLSRGDIMTVYQSGKTFNYEVDGYEIVERTAIDVTYPTNTGQLTLITCNNWNSEKGQYEQRLVVTSHLIEE